jgi:protein-glutamine gamma-glutamyltransferase
MIQLTLPRWRHLQHLPRDARDTLFHLAVVGWTILPHANNLPLWCIALATLMLLWRAQLAVNNGPLPSRWVVAGVLLLACALTWWSERTLLGKEAGVTMLVVLITLKTLELRARRDAMVMFFLGFFLVLTHFLYSQSLLVALSMLISVWGLLTALVLSHMPVGRPALARASAIAARSALLGAPIMVVLFVLFPRFGPLWGMPQDAAGRTGLSGSLRLGGIAELANDDSVALRVRFFDGVPVPQERYFRGPVLSAFNGREWSRQQLAPEAASSVNAQLQTQGPPLRYEMTLEASRLATLPLLEITPQRTGAAPVVEGFNLWLRPDMEWATDRPIGERVRFEASAWPSHRHGPRAFELSLLPFLQLPDGSGPRTRAWAQAWRAAPERSGSNTAALVAELLRHVRDGGYTYTLTPGTYGSEAIDEFWLDRKLGFCEHFAVSFVFIMRSLQVPARIVTGYQGSDPEPVDGFYVVRQSHAHAWAEYWQAGVGWVRVDPTAAVAPDRIQASRNLVAPAGLMANALRNVDPVMAAQLRAAWEALNNRWNQHVLNYSRGQQFELLRLLGVGEPNWHDLAYVLLVLLSSAGLAGAAWALWDRHRQDPWQRLQRRVLERLAAVGVTVLPHHPPRQRAEEVRRQLGPEGEALAQTLDSLDRARYAGAEAATPASAWWRSFNGAATVLVSARRPG